MVITKETKIKMVLFIFICLFLIPIIRFSLGNYFFLNDIYMSFLCGMFCIWGIYVRQRIIDKRCSNLFLLLSFCMIIAEMLKNIKFQQVVAGSVEERYLWYAYYIPILYMVQISFFLSLCMLKNEREQPLKKWKWLTILTFLFCIIIMTNDYHQLMFVFPKGVEVGTSIYGYGPFYFIIVFYIGILIATLLVIIFKKCSLPQCRRFILVPLSIVGIAFFYIILNALCMDLRINGRQIFLFIDTVCFTTLCVWESCIQLGLFPGNSGYKEIFQSMGIDAWIVNSSGEVIYTGNRRNQIPENVKKNEKGDFMIDENTRLHQHKIMGGIFYYTEDLTAINQLRAELAEVNEVIAGENTLIEEENLLKEENIRYQTLNHVYDEIAKEVHFQVVEIEKLLSDNNLAEELFRKNLAKATFLNVYIKRRSNFILQSMQDEQLDIMELYLAIHESLSYLCLCHVDGFICPCKKRVRLEAKILLEAYSFFQNFVENSISELKSIMVMIVNKERELELRFLYEINGSELFIPSSTGNVELEKDENVLILSLKKDGDNI